MINHQISLASQVFRNPKFDNAQHVLEIVELHDFDIEKTKVAEKKTFEAFKRKH